MSNRGGLRDVKRFKAIFVGAAVAIAALMMLPTAGMAATQPKGKGLHGLYNARYCEIFSVTSLSPTIAVDVYNTIGLNTCPPAEFEAVDLNAVKAQLGSLLTLKNGPRHWVIDGITGATAGEPMDIAGMDFRLVGVLTPPSLNPDPFTEITINRTTTWNYKKGRNLRVAVSPTGVRYAMQAYTNTIDPTMTEKKLNSLGSNPATGLPEGWKFKTRKLKHKLELRANGVAHIVRDGLGGVYQRFTWPKPKPKPKQR